QLVAGLGVGDRDAGADGPPDALVADPEAGAVLERLARVHVDRRRRCVAGGVAVDLQLRDLRLGRLERVHPPRHPLRPRPPPPPPPPTPQLFFSGCSRRWCRFQPSRAVMIGMLSGPTGIAPNPGDQFSRQSSTARSRLTSLTIGGTGAGAGVFGV